MRTLLANFMRVIHETYHSSPAHYAGRYRAEYCLNWRYELAHLVPRLVCVVVRTPPLPERLLYTGWNY